MPSDPESINPDQINTDGGAFVDGTINTSGGDFIGRDKVVITEETAYTVHGLTNPYLGLRAFGYEDRAIYAGREQLAQETIQRLTSLGVQQALLFITGASGSGKSSFAQAGLIPLLESHYAAYSKTVRHTVLRPSSQPLVMLADALLKLHPDLTPATLAMNTPKEQINLLLIDQFEELFIQSEAGQRAPFCDFLTNLPSFAECRTHILITLRVDYLDELFAIQPLWAIAKEGVELRTMQPDDLRNAIQKPLQVHHPLKRFAPELLDRLVQEASEDAALLPLLQVTLAELWKTGRLVLSNYHNLTNAIRQHADTVYDFRDYDKADPKIKRSTDEQQALMSILLDLINVSVDGDDRRDARQRRTRQELEQGSTQRPRLIEELVNARLLAAASETRNGAEVEVIDIIHESLIDNWERLRNAIEEQCQQLQRRVRFKLLLGDWLRNGRQVGYLLLTDMQLAEARVLVEVRDIEMRGVEAQNFHSLSLEYRETERQKELKRVKELAKAQQRRLQTLRWGVSAAIVLTLLALGFAGWGWRNSITASNNEATAIAAHATADQNAVEAKFAQANAEQQAGIAHRRQLAAQSEATVEKNYQLSLLLAVEAISNTKNITTNPFIGAVESILHARLERQLSGFSLAGHKSEVRSIAFSSDGKWLASGSRDRTLKIWRIGEWQLEPIMLYGYEAEDVHSVTFSGDGKWLASGSGDEIVDGFGNIVRVWKVGEWQTEPVVLHGHWSPVYSVAFSHDGKWLASGSKDRTLQVWEVGNWETDAVVLHGHENAVNSVTFSNDGKLLASGSQDGTLRVWRVGEWQVEPVVLLGHERGGYSEIMSVAFSNDGEWLASGNSDGTLKIWKVGEWQVPSITLHGHENTVNSVAFSSDSKWLASGGNDKTVRMWRVGEWQWQMNPIISRGHEDAVSSVAFSSDSNWLASGSLDKTLRVWQTEPVIVHGHVGENAAVAFSNDGKWLASSSQRNMLRVWSVGEWQAEPIILPGSKPVVSALGFSNDNRLLASGSWDGVLRVWQVGEWQIEPVLLLGHESEIYSVAFSSDDKWLASSSYDGTVRVWRVGQWQAKPLILRGHESNVYSVAFSHDGKWLASSSYDGTVRVWRVGQWQAEPLILRGHEDAIYSIAFSRNSKWLASGDLNGLLRIWRVGQWQAEPLILRGHEDAIYSVVFSNDGKWLASGGKDSTLRMWQVEDWQTEPVILHGHEDAISSIAFSSDSKWLASSSRDETLRVWTVSIDILLEKICRLSGRNFDLSEWLTYIGELNDYRPTCSTAQIPDNVLNAIQQETQQQIRGGQVISATQRLEELNGWLKENGQFDSFGVKDVDVLMAEVLATATAEAQPAQ
jgi:WD40 repeat protein